MYKLNELFQEEDISINTMSEYGELPIHIAAKRRSISEMKCLLHAGVDVNATTDDGQFLTALHYSIGQGDFEMMRLLLHSGADFEIKSGFGYTPFDLAIMIGEEKFIYFLYSFMSGKGY